MMNEWTMLTCSSLLAQGALENLSAGGAGGAGDATGGSGESSGIGATVGGGLDGGK